MRYVTLRLNQDAKAIRVVNKHGQGKLAKLVGRSFVGPALLVFSKMGMKNVVANGCAKDWFGRPGQAVVNPTVDDCLPSTHWRWGRGLDGRDGWGGRRAGSSGRMFVGQWRATTSSQQ